MLSVDDLTMIYGDRILFRGVTLHFSTRRRYGLVGANGAGKTTFLKILKGTVEPSGGTVNIPKEARLGMLDQDYSPFENVPILDLVMMGDKELWSLLKKKEKLLAQEKVDPEVLSEIEEQLTLKGGYRAHAKGAQLLSGLGIPSERQSAPLSTLSGGYKLRVLLAQVLFIEPEILLLDEPTNYLDLFSIRWLERYLIDYPGTLILSSHDRLFLNQVCQEIIDLDYGEMRRYVGNFDHFIQQKEKNVLVKEAELKSLSKRKKEIQRFIDRFKAKATKARQASSRERMIEKLEEEEKGHLLLPSSRQYPHFHFTSIRPPAQRALRVKGISKAFGEHAVLNNISFEVGRFEKVALVGPNGVGKSTLLEILTDHIKGDEGTALWGSHARYGYFPQNFRRLLNMEETLYDWLSKRSKGIPEQKVRQALGKMLFDEHAVRKKVSALSGGEGARLVFVDLMLAEHNCLVLDEPTNHLDMESVEALIAALKEYSGTLIMVSHNRYFISKISERIIELTPGEITDFQGGYEDFVKEHERDYLKEEVKEKKEIYHEKKEHRKERNRLKREIERLENEIAKTESEIEKVNETLATPGFYEKKPPIKQQEVINQKDKLEKKRENALNQWEAKIEEFDSNY
ncbi:ATP-binding cassette domain-containing protein [Candidatus Neptunochlamydia vexilliferae]|uniref:ABC transporter ATP-binding protein YbiT n=1 Tax=Candidatus Neptunichlamydia vexilliferae TaxID=1651774 RepID=A0ABS0AXI0_9BACT|nr:ABC-F family ATP-binding cassette domain-containing protein [Candidatus Neptunochlamydia vexilliferae]MBF5058844.1 putative ABC transporter ATP-binding protein YbiT [Candidatus Neptunochlamydia vexilliferae]